jgi:hypothetical protein
MVSSPFIHFSPPHHAENTPSNSVSGTACYVSGINQIIEKAKQILELNPVKPQKTV